MRSISCFSSWQVLSHVSDPPDRVVQFESGVSFASEYDSLVDYVKSGQPAEGHDKIRVAGEPEQESMQKRKLDGIPIDDNTWAEMTKLGCENGMNKSDFEKIV